MAYNDFSLETVTSVLGVSVGPADLFPGLDAVSAPAWLREALDRGMRQVLLTEKARSEFIVLPVLLGCQETTGGVITSTTSAGSSRCCELLWPKRGQNLETPSRTRIDLRDGGLFVQSLGEFFHGERIPDDLIVAHR